MARTLDGVIAQMQAARMPELPEQLEVNAGRISRFGKGKRGWYRVLEYTTRKGTIVYVGAFGWWGAVDATKIEPDLDPGDEAERQRFRDEMQLRQQRELARRARLAQRAADNALETWREADPHGASEYLARKQVPIAGGWVRYHGVNVVVPMVRYDQPSDGRLKGVQIIRPDGEKRFTSGMEKTGCAAVLGHHQVREPILIAEGLATAASCWLALGRRYRTVVAFDAGNLAPVARIVRTLHADARILFCADDDFRDPERQVDLANTGRAKAKEAAEELGRAGVVFPIFRDRSERRLTDFNDLHCTEGLDEVAAQLTSALKWLPRV